MKKENEERTREEDDAYNFHLDFASAGTGADPQEVIFTPINAKVTSMLLFNLYLMVSFVHFFFVLITSHVDNEKRGFASRYQG